MHCLYCHQPFLEKVSWRFVIGLTSPPLLCRKCEEKLETIKGEICDKCGRPMSHLETHYRLGNECHDCVRWGDSPLAKNRSLYVYNDFLQEMIAKWKYRGDAVLADAFQSPLRNLTRTFDKLDYVVPIPLNKNRLYERSFNQALLLAEKLKLPTIEALIRPVEEVKQSKKTRQERLNSLKSFQIDLAAVIAIQGKTILLIDDIYTTGATLHAAARVLKEHGVCTIYSITIARG